MSKLAVIALGGNALFRGNQRGTVQEQLQNVNATLRNIIPLIKRGYNIVIGHGNGPQVGNILLQHDAGAQLYEVPQMPLDICVADSQGFIGYMLEKSLRNILKEEGIQKDIVTLVTQVVVSKDDPAFNNYTKRVGKIFPKTQADQLAKEKGWLFKPSPKGDDAWRRVVPSPTPIEIINESIIQELAQSGTIVIAAGGGGVPVYYDDEGQLHALEAVIDKDATSSLLATRIRADEFIILTDIPYLYQGFGTPNQIALTSLNKSQIEQMRSSNVFGEGNMLPKVNAALRFVENGGTKSLITEATQLAKNNSGTLITLY